MKGSNGGVGFWDGKSTSFLYSGIFPFWDFLFQMSGIYGVFCCCFVLDFSLSLLSGFFSFFPSHVAGLMRHVRGYLFWGEGFILRDPGRNESVVQRKRSFVQAI